MKVLLLQRSKKLDPPQRRRRLSAFHSLMTKSNLAATVRAASTSRGPSRLLLLLQLLFNARDP